MDTTDIDQCSRVNTDEDLHHHHDDDQLELIKEKSKPKNYKLDIVWRNVIGMIVLHVAAVYGYFTMAWNADKPWYGAIVIDTIGRISIIGVTAGAHRLWSHRSYKATLPLRIFLMLLQTMSLQDDLYQWCRDHRLHHRYSDTDADPYNAKRGLFFSHMGWLLVRKQPEVIAKGKTINLDDVMSDPVVRFQRRFYIPLVIIFWGVVPTYILHWATGVSLAESMLGAVFFRYMFSLHYTWTVNSLAHYRGHRAYDKNLDACANLFVVYGSMGEGYHNYHHAYPYDYSASEFGWERCFNVTTLFIDTCVWLGLASDRRKPDSSLVQARVLRVGEPEVRKSFVLQAKPVVEYLLGFLAGYWLALLTWSIRYCMNGHI